MRKAFRQQFVLAGVACSAVMLAQQRPAKAPAHIKTAKELEEGVARVDQLFGAEFAKEHLASVTVGVISGPNLVWTKSYGMANMEKQLAATVDTEYRIGSITKQFTGVMLLQLVDQGKVHLSDPVEKYYPEIHKVANAYPWAPPVTLIELATHTSGLDREPGDAETYLAGQVADWERTLVAALPHTKFLYEPGTHYSYSNIGYAILGAALARAAEDSYIHYVQTHILAPLGMKRTAFEQNDEIVTRLAKGYIIRDGSADPSVTDRELRTGRGYKIPNGALFTTVEDLAHFVSFEMGDGPEAVLKKAIMEDNRTRVSSSNGQLSFGYGVGFMLYRKGELEVYGHGGSVAGFVAGAYYQPQTHVGLVYFRNAGGSGFRQDLVMSAIGALAQ
jgi:CubicO group peptidase (beta-lactamase class C family)